MVSMPHKVSWCGFETTTPRLQQAGWQIAVQYDPAYMGIRLVMKHEGMQCQAVTNQVDYMRALHSSHSLYVRHLGPNGEDSAILHFHVVRMAHRLGFTVFENVEGSFVRSWSAIDAMPQMVKNVGLDDMQIFATPLTRTEELIVDPNDVASILEKIRQAQLPEQKAIRARERLRESREGLRVDAEPQMNFHAQILSIAA
jgi:hypothetical protein